MLVRQRKQSRLSWLLLRVYEILINRVRCGLVADVDLKVMSAYSLDTPLCTVPPESDAGTWLRHDPTVLIIDDACGEHC
jgi:hypothetical protein